MVRSVKAGGPSHQSGRSGLVFLWTPLAGFRWSINIAHDALKISGCVKCLCASAACCHICSDPAHRSLFRRMTRISGLRRPARHSSGIMWTRPLCLLPYNQGPRAGAAEQITGGRPCGSPPRAWVSPPSVLNPISPAAEPDPHRLPDAPFPGSSALWLPMSPDRDCIFLSDPW